MDGHGAGQLMRSHSNRGAPLLQRYCQHTRLVIVIPIAVVHIRSWVPEAPKGIHK